MPQVESKASVIVSSPEKMHVQHLKSLTKSSAAGAHVTRAMPTLAPTRAGRQKLNKWKTQDEVERKRSSNFMLLNTPGGSQHQTQLLLRIRSPMYC